MVRKIILLAVVAAVLVSLSFLFVNKKDCSEPRHIFINETADHRFDESIRTSILGAFARTKVQNAVVITNNVDSATMEESAEKLFSTLRVGKCTNGRGILYLFSPQKNVMKIEVGYALEPSLPDVIVRALELAAKTFTYSDHYQDFWAELINTVNIRIEEQEKGSKNDAYDFSKYKFLSGGAGVNSRDYETTLSQLNRELNSRPEDQRYQASTDVHEALNTYLASLHDGVGSPTLKVLSPESGIYRNVVPTTTYQLYRNWDMYSRAGIDKIIEENNLAFVFFKQGIPVLPIVLKKQGGLWKVAEPLSWSLFHRFEDSSRVFLKYPINAVSNALQSYFDKNLGKPLYKLKAPIRLANLGESRMRNVYFNFFWLDAVEKILEADLQSVNSIDDLWIVADLSLNLGKMSRFAKFYSAAASMMPENQDIQANAKFYEKMAEFESQEWQLAR